MKKTLIVVALLLAACGQAPVAPLLEAPGMDESVEALDKSGHQKRFREIDENNNDVISLEEWVEYHTRGWAARLKEAQKQGDEARIAKLEKAIAESTEKAQKMFKATDADKNGTLAIGEYVAGEQNIFVKDCGGGKYGEADTDKNGAVNRSEWVALSTVAAETALKYVKKHGGDAARLAKAEKDLAKAVKNAELIFKILDMDKDEKLSCAEFAMGARRSIK